MSYVLIFECDCLTETERDIVLAKLNVIKYQVFNDLKVEYSVLHRANRIWINQEINDTSVALECFRLLSNFSFPKEYDEYYDYGCDSTVTCQLSYTDCVELGDGECVVKV